MPRPPRLQDLPEGAIHGESKWAAREGTTFGTCNKESDVFFEKSVEVSTSKAEVVHREGDKAFSGA